MLILCFWLINYETSFANQLTETKRQLAKITNKIRHTENSLSDAKQKYSTLQKQLAIQEKKIGRLIVKKNQLAVQINKNNEDIISLSQQIKQLDKQISKEQGLLAQQTRSLYTIDHHQPLKWLLSPNSKAELSQMLTYYQYVIHAQQNSIQSIKSKTDILNGKKIELSDRITQDKSMHDRLAKQQSQLQLAQKNQQFIIQRLNRTITTKSQQLKEYRENRAGLTNIVSQLTKQDRIAQSKPFASRRHHLPRPVSVAAKNIKPIHQGLAFFANEGTPVKAIHPGKILFSDWLKGYGLLLIIDHGHGYMTLYAHNQALTKQKGDWVEGGEKIAEIGHSGGLRENGLYFEIRHNGKAISPINWLS